MGLCKCPKRAVTNQFCFEHRVNVCEHCILSHPKCIVQSYLQWLRDSDYISNCTLCGTTLEQGDCVRLVCYHVFHWDCLNARQAGLPANTAPRGHQCPSCNVEIFPASNLVSPVADALKNYLSQVNWGRNGLGLALLTEDQSNSLKAVKTKIANQAAISNVTKVHHHSAGERSKPNGGPYAGSGDGASPHSVLLMDAFNPPSSGDLHASSRRPLLPRQSPIGGPDRDENKYKRRTPAELFSRWTRRFYAPSSRPPWRRTWFLVTSGIVGFIVLIYIMAVIGRSDSNSLDDSWNNPNPNPNPQHYD
ncbi:zinc finger protein-like 1 homolog [Scaptodrosophila lebanonensis]|uniref:Zinc finger protein-like 1 homolog n=1 Tax=Drosophila lebanonensis TaxID=7225 RepID=A0A6J2T1U1_DROLE|nr:zinc finger protein-like 1 homolog [Scaptodrosophila lebanonensis]